MCLFMNFIGQVSLYTPCLILQLKRYESVETSSSLNEPEETNEIQKTKCVNLNNKSVQKPPLTSNTKLKYFILILFTVYFISNVCLISNNLKSNLPLTDLMPSESYLNEHMKNHVKHFRLGPMIVINFMRPLNYSNNQTYNKINSFIKDAQNINGLSKFSLSWLLSTKKNQQDCTDNYSDKTESECFEYGLVQTIKEDTYFDDVNFADKNNTDGLINSSRIFLQMKKFTGMYDEVVMWNDLKVLAEEKYNFSRDSLVIFSSVYGLIEQLSEIFPSVIAILMLSVECLFFGGLFLVFDLKSIFIQIIIGVSLVVSILANMSFFNLSLNIVNLFQLIMLPAFIFEFLFYSLYLFLYQTVNIDLNNDDKLIMEKIIEKNKIVEYNTPRSSSSESSSEILQVNCDDKQCADNENNNDKERIESSNQMIKIKNIKFLMQNCTDISFIFLFTISLFFFGLKNYCTTFNFYSLFLILMITCFNILIHLCFFYPNLLMLFGTSWKEVKKS